MTRRLFKLVHAEARAGALQCVKEAPPGFVVTVAEPTRSLDANAAMWVYLQAFSEQLEWPVNGQMTRLEPEEFKQILSAAFRQENVRLAQGLDGGMVMLGARTSKFSVREMSEFIEFLAATAAARGVEIDQREAAHG